MLQNAYFVAKIGADTAENEQHFAENLPKINNYPTGPPSRGRPRGRPRARGRAPPGTSGIPGRAPPGGERGAAALRGVGHT